MKAWIFDGVVMPILDSEYDSTNMGKMYDLSWVDNENLEEARLLRDHAEKNLTNMNNRIAAKLRKEQGE